MMWIVWVLTGLLGLLVLLLLIAVVRTLLAGHKVSTYKPAPDPERAERYARARNPRIRIFYISAKTGEGVEALAEEILARVNAWNAQDSRTAFQDGGKNGNS
jgi:GTPase Era involved in 16S rRNA processing